MGGDNTWENLTKHFSPEDRKEVEREKERLRSELAQAKQKKSPSVRKQSSSQRVQTLRGGKSQRTLYVN